MHDWWSEKYVCTSEKIEDEDEAVRLGEDGMDLYVWLEKKEVRLGEDRPI